MKIKLQEKWQNRQQWDEDLPEDLQQFVKDWTTNSSNSNDEIQTPQYYNLPTAQSIELHVSMSSAMNASTQVLATVIFIHFADKTAYRTKLVMGKTGVAPLKPRTIPKVELQAALHASRQQRAFIENATLPTSKIKH